MEEDLKEIMAAGLSAADPEKAVARTLEVESDNISAGGENFEAERVFILSTGKAAGPMARAAAELLGDRLAGGLVVTKDDHDEGPEILETIYASHPEPDERGVEAASKAREWAESLGEGDLLLALISGGASALLADPAPPIKIADLQQLTSDLLKSGADIEEINGIRKHVSVLKGGGLASLVYPAPTIALLLSDVVGDEPSSIASGPTTPDLTTLEDARETLAKYEIQPPESISEHLDNTQENPKPGDEIFDNVVNVVCGGGRHASEAASEKARELGYEPILLSTLITGDAAASGELYAAIVRETLESGNPVSAPCAIVSGGEATVTVRGNGTGGPNLEFALALAVELDGTEGWTAFAIDTDGNDGSTDAAGGLISGATARKIRDGGMSPAGSLADNDAYPALKAADALVLTGPTGTNVNDLRVALVE